MNKDAVAEISQQYQVEAAKKLVPEGYKQTEVGVIPEDWKIEVLDDCTVKVGSGKTPTGGSSVYVDTGRPFIRSQNVERGGLDLSDVAYITDDIHSTFLGSELKENDVLLNITGASIGRCAKANKLISGGNVNQHVCIIRTVEEKLVPSLLVELINSRLGQEQIDSYQAGGNREGLNFKQVRQLKFPVAKSIREQFSIANALSDTDALLSELEKLIAKKQAIKTATMQQLLTGRTRLPQFAHHSDGSKKGYKQSELGEIPEDWEAKNFGDLFEPSITRKKTNPSEMISFVGMQDVSESAQLVNQSQIQYSTIRSGFTYFEKDDVLVAKITPCFENGKGCHAVNLKTDIGFGSTEFHVLRATNLSDSRFIYFWTTRESFRAELETEMVGSAGHRRVPLAALQNYLIPCPSDKQEQTTIAAILSDMDEEIQALEQRLNKTRQIKQGMMQELLTGKTRLVASQSR